ncbi:hypothetical protein AAC387_Pa11g0494 [Persea americana]
MARKTKTPSRFDISTTNKARRGRITKRRSQKMGETVSWSVYLIISSQLPKTYVGATNDFSRRLKQHNGKLKGGAKASHAGRPWTCACIVQGFKDQSEACMFESKWKSFSRKLPRKKEVEDTGIGADDGAGSLHLLKHREAALNRVKGCVDCSHLDIEWHQDPF